LLEPLIVSKPPFSPVAGNSEASIVHAAPASPTMDVYLTAPGAVLSAANPIGTVAFSQQIAPSTFAAGDYQLSFTETGNPLNVLFTSPTMTFVPGQSNFFAIADPGDETNESVVVRYTQVATGLGDINAPSSLRMINAATDAQPRDVFLDGDFTVPLFAAVPHAAPTARVPIPTGDRRISITPAGNSGVIEIESISPVVPGATYTGLVAGVPGALVLTGYAENRRRVIGEAHLRYYNAAAQFSSLQIVMAQVVAPFPIGFPLVLANGNSLEELPLAPGDYEMSVFAAGATTAALGPLTITVASEGLYSILLLNGPTPDTASVVLFDDFQ
jgi:hypothetical protein